MMRLQQFVRSSASKGAFLARRLRHLLSAHWCESSAFDPPSQLPALVPPRLVVRLRATDRGSATDLVSLSPYLDIEQSDVQLPRDAIAYEHLPETLDHCLGVHALVNCLLCLAHRRLDFLLVSSGLEEPPALVAPSPWSALIVSTAARASLHTDGVLPRGARGKLLRILPSPWRCPGIRHEGLSSLGFGPLRADGEELWTPSPDGTRPSAAPPNRPSEPLFTVARDPRPLVLVLPVFMAVGGVERNLIEVMRRLRDRYRFVVVTTERPSVARGSLNESCLQHCDALFELGELAPQSEHIVFLESIARSFRPDLVFVCNGSPWLLQNASALRELFRDIPIVDQQAYDVREGWIAHYDNPGIRSFDRFVAINAGIRRVFLERYGIDAERVDLIYHAIDDNRFNLDTCDRVASDSADPMGLRGPGRLFAMVGRLTAQKRPLRFLDLARRVRRQGLDDRFVLVGDGELATECDEFIQKHDLEFVRRVSFCPDMERLLGLVDGLMLTSAYEGLPVVVLEALAMGIPVFSTDVGEVRPLLERYEVGAVVEPHIEGDELLHAFLRWRAELPDHRGRARRAACEIARRFSGAAVADAYDRSWRRAREECVG